MTTEPASTSGIPSGASRLRSAPRPGSATPTPRTPWILCEADDPVAAWAYRGLRRRGLARLELATAPQLANARRYEHRIDGAGVRTAIELFDGRCLSSRTVEGVINRLHTIPCAALPRADTGDRTYAWQELQAFFTSWLHGLPGLVVNRGEPLGLAGRPRDSSAWFALAARAGLPFRPHRRGASFPAPAPDRVVSVVVFGDAVFGPDLPSELAAGCRRFAAASGLEMVGLCFERPAAGRARSAAWRFLGATPTADLSAGGEPLLDALATAFGSEHHGDRRCSPAERVA